MIDTHAHLDGDEFLDDLAAVIERAKAAGVERIFVPSIDLWSCGFVLDVTRKYPGFLFPMLGLHPEEVSADFKEELAGIRKILDRELAKGTPIVAIGEVGLDFYQTREYEKQQTKAFRKQLEWSVELKLPLMIHCRKGQNETVRMMKEFRSRLVGGVFHCFTGNEQEAAELLQFDNFMLGIGGVVTFKNSGLPSVLAAAVPLDRIVLETDAPYMAPVPIRGSRNESANLKYVVAKLAEVYGVSEETINQTTTDNCRRLFSRVP